MNKLYYYVRWFLAAGVELKSLTDLVMCCCRPIRELLWIRYSFSESMGTKSTKCNRGRSVQASNLPQHDSMSTKVVQMAWFWSASMYVCDSLACRQS